MMTNEERWRIAIDLCRDKSVPVGSRWQEFAWMARELECYVDEALAEAGLEGQYERLSEDSYDTSIELHECSNDLRLTLGQQAVLWQIGFQRCWLNHRDGSETYYHQEGDPAGFRKEAGHRAEVTPPSPSPA